MLNVRKLAATPRQLISNRQALSACHYHERLVLKNEMPPQNCIWTLLPNGNVLHRSGLELESNGDCWQMTPASGIDFSVFTMMEQGLSVEESKGLAELLIWQGATWATSGLH